MKIKKIIMNIASVITALSMLMSGTAVFAEVLLSGAVNLNSGKRYFNSAMYENYIYALTTTDQCLDVFDMDTLEKTCSIAMSYNHSQPFNRYVYIKNDELYALANDGIHRYSLKNPAEPEEIKLYSSYKSYDYLEVEDNYMYLPYFGNEGLISVNLDTGEKTKISDTKYTGLFYYNGYLYAINKNTVDVYNTENGFEIPELIAQKDFGANIIGINAIGNTLFMTAWTDSQSVMDLWWIDISEPELLESRSFSKWVAPGTGNRRLADINFVNGLMLVPSTDNKMYTFDITDEENGVVRDIVLLETLSIQGNPYRFSMNQSKMSFQNTYFMLYDYSIDYMQISSSEINKLPILITGKAIGQQNVCVELAGQKRNVSVDEFGHFEAIFDDTKIPNGEYTVTAYSTDNEEAVDEKTITIAAERLSLSADYEKGKASAALTNYSDDYTAAVILAGYKDNQMADYDLSEIILTGNDETNAELNINDADYDFVKIMAVRKTDNGYIPEADMIVYGSDNREKVIPDIDNGGFEIRCDMNFSEGVVTVNAAASDAKTDILVIAEKPEGEGYEYIDMIPSSEKTGIMFALKAPMIENKPYSVTISAIGAGDYLYKKGEFTYVGEDTVNAILKSISEKTDEKEFFEALKENSELINVDMSEKSDFAALTETYRTEVFNALTGKDYSVLGAVRLKLDFDGAVSEQLHKKKVDDGLAELNNAQSVTEFENALKNNSALEIDIEKDSFYRLLSESSKIKVFDNIKNTEYADIESLKKDYEIYSSLWYINDAKYSDIEKRIDESKEVTKIKFPNEFNSFTNVQKTLYFTKIADKDYETVS
ncbi:MAG: hypothetical protein SOZ34_11970, partial [Clostridia bacterium]|nr:hypothetical protein [Clostridia bacterium]